MTKLSTKLATLGRTSAAKVHLVNPPITRGSTILFDNYEDFKQSHHNPYPSLDYARRGTSIIREVEDVICQLEEGIYTRVTPSGMSAISTASLALCAAGDHILVTDHAYGPARDFYENTLPQFGIEVDFYPPTIGGEISRYFKENTRFVHVESPGSFTFDLQDIPAIAKAAHANNVLVLADGSWASPILMQTLKLGADVAVQSLTKYMSGHSDVMYGAITAGNEEVRDKIHQMYTHMGMCTSPDDAYLVLRGLRTVELRLKQQQENALQVVNYLKTQDAVDYISCPMDPDHPQHTLWQRDFNGCSALFSFVLKKDYTEEKIAKFVDTLDIFHLGHCWGAYESLIYPDRPKRAFDCWSKDRIVIRLSIGLEDPQDLIQDLEKGFKAL